jgi:hypothetical protein
MNSLSLFDYLRSLHSAESTLSFEAFGACPLCGLVVVFFAFFSGCYVDLYFVGLQRSMLYLLWSGATAFAGALEEPAGSEEEDCDGQQ